MFLYNFLVINKRDLNLWISYTFADKNERYYIWLGLVWFTSASSSWWCLIYTSWLGCMIISSKVPKPFERGARAIEPCALVVRLLESVLSVPGVRYETESSLLCTQHMTSQAKKLWDISSKLYHSSIWPNLLKLEEYFWKVLNVCDIELILDKNEPKMTKNDNFATIFYI